MSKSLLLLMTPLLFFFNLGFCSQSVHNFQTFYEEDLTSRFIEISDPKINSLACISLRDTWWSRFYEYAWASKFVGDDLDVLDAACGISHPFKWYLSETCSHVTAIDSDPRISSIYEIVKETGDDLGKEARDVLLDNPLIYKKVDLVKGSICLFPLGVGSFDRIFCISTLEHLKRGDQISAMSEFSKHLNENGLLIITVDYPVVKPEVLISIADSVGLKPVGEVILEIPEKALTNGVWMIYRFVFTHKTHS